jgi:hypothetical protein
MGKMSREKGRQFEQKVVRILRGLGLHAQRGASAVAQGRGFACDVLLYRSAADMGKGVVWLRVECRNRTGAGRWPTLPEAAQWLRTACRGGYDALAFAWEPWRRKRQVLLAFPLSHERAVFSWDMEPEALIHSEALDMVAYHLEDAMQALGNPEVTP